MISSLATLPDISDNIVRQTTKDKSTCYEYRLNEKEMRKHQIFTDCIESSKQADKTLSLKIIWDAYFEKQKSLTNQRERMRSYSNYKSMKKCYQAYFQDKSEDVRFNLIFEKYAGLLAQLPIRQSFVDFSINRQMVEFVLKLDDKLFVTVDKPLDTVNDINVLLTVSRQHKLLFYNLVRLGDIISTINGYLYN